MDNFEQNQNYEYIRERMKKRPINRKKLMRRSIITALMAVIFGAMACFTFLLLEPVISNFLYPESEPEQIEIPKEQDEMLPEEMLITEETEGKTDTLNPSITIKEELEVSDYENLYDKIYEVTKDTSKGMVTVTGVSQDVDWFNNPYESAGQTSGVIIADTGKDYYILCDLRVIKGAENLHVTFVDGTVHEAVLKQQDKNTDLAVVTVAKHDIPSTTKEAVKVVKLGSSRQSSLLATQVIALGRPYGSTGSVVYGMITSKNNMLNMTDCNYELLTTDIYGSEKATGILVNLSGEVVGVINQNYNKSEVKNIISAIGITDLKKTIERMSNGKETTFLGIRGVDVTQEVNQTLGVPFGAYVTGIVMDSPAMEVGIQSGDIISQINDEAVTSFSKYMEILMNLQPGETVELKVMRRGQDEYRELEMTVVLESYQ